MFYQDKNVLVAGGTGFIGSNLIKQLLMLGANVSATMYQSDPVIQDDRIQYIRGDLRDADNCKQAVQNIDYVFMCAANTSGAAVMTKTPLVHLTPNLIMNVQMMEAAYDAGVKKFLFISSNTVYPVTEYAVKEDDVNHTFFEKYFIVGWMKRFSEIVCEMYSTKIKEPMKTVVVRPGNLYGEYDKYDWEKSKVVAALIRRAIERHDPFEVWGDGMDIKDFMYIGDFIEGMCLAMEKIDSTNPINIASGQPVTIRETLQTILKVCDYENANVIFDSTKPTMIPKRMIDVSKAKTLLDFEAKTSLHEGIRRTVAWYRECYNDASVNH